MSRIIVKNLPEKITSNNLLQFFENPKLKLGNLTDCSLKYDPLTGNFRRFAFVGFKRPDAAELAVQKLNKSFIGSSRIQVEICRPLKLQPTPDSSSLTAKLDHRQDASQDPKRKRIGEPIDDIEFREFLSLHSLNANNSHSPDDLFEVDRQGDPQLNNSEPPSSAAPSKSSASPALPSPLLKITNPKQKGQLTSSSSTSADSFALKMSGLPKNTKKDSIKQFFAPLKVLDINILKVKACGTKDKSRYMSVGTAVVRFGNESDVKAALRRHKSFIGNKKVFLHRVAAAPSKSSAREDAPPAASEAPSDGSHVAAREARANAAPREGEEPAPAEVCETGRLFLRNLPYACAEADLEALLAPFGPLVELHLPVARLEGERARHKGFAFATFLFAENAARALAELDGSVFMGRLLHVIPAHPNPHDNDKLEENAKFKDVKKHKQKSVSASGWNALFLGANAVVDAMTEKYGAEKRDLLDPLSKGSLAVRVGLGETELVNETRAFLEQHGVNLDAFSRRTQEEAGVATHSRRVLLVKNLRAGTTAAELEARVAEAARVAPASDGGGGGGATRPFTLLRLILPPHGLTAIAEFASPSEARVAFRALSYASFKDQPMYLEWAPSDVFGSDSDAGDEAMPSAEQTSEQPQASHASGTADAQRPPLTDEHQLSGSSNAKAQGSTLFVKNLAFSTTEEQLRDALARLSDDLRAVHIPQVLASAAASEKGASLKTGKQQQQLRSAGYAFVELGGRESAARLVKEAQHVSLDGHQLELQVARAQPHPNKGGQQKAQSPTQSELKAAPASSKLLVRNVPFQAKQREIRQLFSAFGELKTVRMPKKQDAKSGTNSHRGFAFVDFATIDDAKRAMEALAASTHLYGRRLVLEWAIPTAL